MGAQQQGAETTRECGWVCVLAVSAPAGPHARDLACPALVGMPACAHLPTPTPARWRRRKRAATGVHFSQDQVMAAFLQVALGLQYLHHSHVLHR